MSIFGILLINKPEGITSFDVIRKLRKITKIRKIGHTGTLDPFASGLLPVCIGKATRISNKIISKDKEYLVKMRLGIKTDTGDITGKIIQKEDVPNLTLNEFKKIIPEIISINEQLPHKFSALKINGIKAYELARENREVKLKPRPINIFNFEILNINVPDVDYKVRVSKGTYIRVLTETIAQKLGAVATTKELKRVKIGDLDIKDAVNLEEINSENWQDYILSINDMLSGFPQLNLTSGEVNEFKFGREIKVIQPDVNDIMVLSQDKKCIGFAEISSNILKPRIVLI